MRDFAIDGRQGADREFRKGEGFTECGNLGQREIVYFDYTPFAVVRPVVRGQMIRSALDVVVESAFVFSQLSSASSSSSYEDL